MRQTALFLFLLIMVSTVSAKAEDIVGKWEGKSPQGEKISYEFKADKSVIWNIDSDTFPGPITAHYSVDYSTKPVKLDMFDFSYAPMNAVRVLAIVEFISPTKIKINAAGGAAGSKNLRPTSFNINTVEFNKVE